MNTQNHYSTHGKLAILSPWIWDVKLFGYRLSFKETTQRFDLQDESVEDKNPSAISSNSGFYYRYQGGAPIIAALTSDLKSRSERPIKAGRTKA